MYPNPYESPDLNLPPKGFGSKLYAHKQNVLPVQSIVQGVVTKLILDQTLWDTLNEFDESLPNYNFTPSKYGYYLIAAQATWNPTAGGGPSCFYLYQDGGAVAYHYAVITANQYLTHRITQIRPLTPNNVVDIRLWQVTGAVKSVAQLLGMTFFEVHRLS